MEFRPDKNGRDSFFIAKLETLKNKDKGGINYGS